MKQYIESIFKACDGMTGLDLFIILAGIFIACMVADQRDKRKRKQSCK